ncbi:hypothetical protein [Sphaerisporangium aureirubrum]|uniref:Uncharacterized protein n=1 Tax=Sphaerisporangium aureirubrum TaxID=1544736 RepID=A0ABW1NPN3_9ACTN
MSIEWVNGAIEEIRAWGRSKDIEVDVEEIRLLCDYASDYLNVGELADITPATFEQLLLDIYPRKVIAPPESAEETVAASLTLVDFLLDSGEIGTKMAARMRDRITEIAPEMPAALADTTKFGMAKSLFAAMGADDEALDGPPQPFPSGFPAVPRPVRQAAESEACDCWECSPLPAVRLPAPEEVAEAVRADGLLRHAHQVVVWMRDGGHTPTARGALRVRDARRITADLGVPAPALAWELALSVGLAEVYKDDNGDKATKGDKAAKGPKGAVAVPEGFRPLAARDDEEVLDLWAGTVAFLTGGPLAQVTGSPQVDAELLVLHDLLYRSPEPLPLETFGDHLSGVWGTDERDPPAAHGGPSGTSHDTTGPRAAAPRVPAHPASGPGEPPSAPAHSSDDPLDGPDEPLDALAVAMDELARFGTVERAEEAVRLTPHGLWGLREVYSRMGMTAPVAPDPAGGDAEGLVAALLGGVTPAQAELDIARWLERRTPAEAAHDLLEAVRGAEAPRRGVAAGVVDRLGPEAAPSVRAFLDDPELRPHAVRWLDRHGLDAPELTPEEILWMNVDTLAVAVPTADDDSAGFARALAAARPSTQVIEEMWRVDHPDVAEVLDLLGRHLPDKDVAKAARKAAFKARSRGIH